MEIIFTTDYDIYQILGGILQVCNVLCCLMTPGLSEDIWCHVGPYNRFAHLQIRQQTTHEKAINLGTADGHFNASSGFVWVCMD